MSLFQLKWTNLNGKLSLGKSFKCSFQSFSSDLNSKWAFYREHFRILRKIVTSFNIHHIYLMVICPSSCVHSSWRHETQIRCECWCNHVVWKIHFLIFEFTFQPVEISTPLVLKSVTFQHWNGSSLKNSTIIKRRIGKTKKQSKVKI